MIISAITASNCTPQTIVIGRRWTYDTMQIAFDLSFLIENYGSGTAVLAVKRSQDESAYPAVVTQEDATLLWTVNETDTAYVGSGECQLMWYVDGGLAKTIIYPIVVMRDILQTDEEPPDGYENWIEHLTELGAKTQRNAQNAAQSASDAEDAKDDAITSKEAAEAALESAETAVTHYPVIINGYWNVWSVETQTYVSTGIKAKGEDGYSPEVTITTITGGHRVTITDKDHPTGQSFDVLDGQGGGGTSDYTSLTNKPKINNVELDGNKTAHDLGLAAQSDIPTVPVQSVNGKTGAVNLASGDIAYDESETYQAGSVGAELQEQNRQLSDLEDTVSTTQIINTASGAIASFDDGADGMQIRKLVAQIEPVQDLHGYDSPWPAGGGANIWDEEWENGYYNIETGEPAVAPSYLRSKSTNYISIIPEANYYVVCPYSLVMCWYDADKNYISDSNASNSILTAPADAKYGRFYIANDAYGPTYKNDISINYPASVTTYSPYSNICPISGHTVAEIERTGKNLLAKPIVLFSTDTPISDCFFMRAGDYVLTCDCLNTYRIGFRLLSPDGALITNADYAPTTNWVYNALAKAFYAPVDLPSGYRTTSFTLVSDCYVRIVKDNNDVTNVMIRLPSDTEAYEPYTGNQISVNWEDEAGTVYGGTVTLNEDCSADLKNDRLFVVLDGSPDEVWDSGGYGADVMWTAPETIYNKTVNPTSYYQPYDAIANYLRPIAQSADWYNYDNFFSHTGRTIFMKCSTIGALANWRSYLSENPLTILFRLKNPETHHFDNIGQLKTFLGTNNIWADTGDVEVTYPADTKLYIDGKLAELQATILENIGG